MSIPTIKAACEYFGLTEEVFFGPRRFYEIIRARSAVIYVMRQRDGQSFSQIGKRICRDHSTVIHGMKRSEQMLVDDDDFAAFVNAQMALPKYSPRAVVMKLVSEAPPPPPVLSKPALPPCPPHLIRLRPDADAKRVKRFQREGLGCRAFLIDDNGISRDEHLLNSRLIRCSKDLVAALQREHPEKFRENVGGSS